MMHLFDEWWQSLTFNASDAINVIKTIAKILLDTEQKTKCIVRIISLSQLIQI